MENPAPHLTDIAARAWTRHRYWHQRDQADFEHFVACEALHHEAAMAPVVDAILSAQSQAPADPARPPAYFVACWTRLGDELPAIGEPILLARWDRRDQCWRVRDAALQVQFEEVVPRISDFGPDGWTVAANWWFDCVYPGKGDMRLPEAEMQWCRMPMPEWKR